MKPVRTTSREPKPRVHRAPEEGDAESSQPAVGAKLAKARHDRGWTLMQLSKASGVAIATLSKVENGKSGASFDTISRVAGALKLRFDDILEPASKKFASGRRSVTRAGKGIRFGFRSYDYEIPCNDLISKAMVPLIMTIKTRSILPIDQWASHEGEEYIHILDGSIELHTEIYGPVHLDKGDSAYIDSMMPHAFVNVGKGDARMLSVCLSGSLKELFGEADVVNRAARKGAADNEAI
jgi:transcriptional regulator with XRE-family HTH domain